MVFKEENEKIPKSPASFYKVFRDFLVTRIRFHLYHLYPDGGQKLSGMNVTQGNQFRHLTGLTALCSLLYSRQQGSVKPTAGSRVAVSREQSKG